MKKLFFALIILLINPLVFAQEKTSAKTGFSYSMPAMEFGFKWNSANQTGSTSDKQVVGFQLGTSAVFDLASDYAIKSGLFYSERPFKSDFAANVEGKGKITYFEVPVFLMLKFEEYAGVYMGPSLAVKLGDEYTPGALVDVKNLVTPITFGAQFKFLPNMGANVFFETVPSDLATSVTSTRAVGVNLLFTLD